ACGPRSAVAAARACSACRCLHFLPACAPVMASAMNTTSEGTPPAQDEFAGPGVGRGEFTHPIILSGARAEQVTRRAEVLIGPLCRPHRGARARSHRRARPPVHGPATPVCSGYVPRGT